jgi:hypothetical protein
MTATDATTRETDARLRTLAAKTLTELREMVAVPGDKNRLETEVAPPERLPGGGTVRSVCASAQSCSAAR